jgi:hypothetical protein
MQAEQPVTKWLLAVNRVGLAIPRWALFNWVKGLMFRTVFFRSSAHRTFDGINLYWVDYSRLGFRKPGNGEEEAFFATVTKALTMLQACDPRRYKRAKRYLKNIVFLPTGNDSFEPSVFSYVVDTFDYDKPELLAACIVHEATHGMLYSKGLKYEADKRRHETICIREEMRTVRRLVYQEYPDLTAEQWDEIDKVWENLVQKALRDEWWDLNKLLGRRAARWAALEQESISNHPEKTSSE